VRGHVDVEVLALYAEGQLSRRRTARVRAHLSGCPECGATLAALAEVSTQLSHVPAAAMPAPVAARLDAALSAESAGRTTVPAPRPPRRPMRSPGALRILAAAGVAVVVAGGAGYAISQFSGSTPAGTSGQASPAVPKPQHRSPVMGAPNISNPGGGDMHSGVPGGSGGSGVKFARSGTDYRTGTLAAQAERQLATYTVSGMSGPGELKQASVPTQVNNCVSQIAQNRPVRFVDLARYQQRPAIVLVLSQPAEVIAVSYSCAPLQSARLPVTSGSPAR
jgi:Putative zinc-finger